MYFQSAARTTLQRSGSTKGSFYKIYKWRTSFQGLIIKSIQIKIIGIQMRIEEHTKYISSYNWFLNT